MKRQEMPLDLLLAHGAIGRRVDAVRGLRAPPHHAVVLVGTAKAVAEEAALPECRGDALADRRVRNHRPRNEAAKTDQAGVDDRRKVFIATVPENVARIGRFYEHMQRGMVELWDTYSDAELRLLLGFASKGYETMLAATEELKSMVEAPTEKPVKKGKASAPRKPSRAP